MTGIELIAAERRRQIEAEGWTPEHDDAHRNNELARAAAAYALPDDYRDCDHWPWNDSWKPTPDDRIRELVKAGALIVAEIDRLQRAAPTPEGRAAPEEERHGR
jgi:hypothetical protein